MQVQKCSDIDILTFGFANQFYAHIYLLGILNANCLSSLVDIL